ncbi:OB-fold-containig protein [Novosphingobium sp. HR1a]|nr:OB-fold-containig protein [Novosphingobium sp. HR1a]
MTGAFPHDSLRVMFSQMLTPAYLPFAFSFVLMIGIGLIEAIGLGLGQFDLDGDFSGDGDGGMLSWLGLGGELPILIWLTSLLGCFTLAGIALQQGMTAIGGAPLPWPGASGGALVAGAALNTFAANGLARILPGFETTVISTDDLLRQRGTILEGTARRGAPARAKVVDRHGQAHFVMVEPHDDADAISSGETALLVRREGQVFFAVPDRPASLRLP